MNEIYLFISNKEGGMFFQNGKNEIMEGLRLFDLNRPLGHVKNSSIIEGEADIQFEKYLGEHAETIVAMANFGLGLYQPTLKLLSLIKPRLQKGSVLVFEDLNQTNWPGETKALFEVFSPLEIQLQRFPFCPYISFMIFGNNT